MSRNIDSYTRQDPVAGDAALGVVGVAGTDTRLFNLGEAAAYNDADIETLAAGVAEGRKNYIINGNIEIAQRGTAAVTTSAGFPVDRFAVASVNNTFSAIQRAFANTDALYATGGSRNFLEVTVTSVAAAGNYTLLRQRIEDVTKLAGKTVAVSFWAKAASGTPLIGCEVFQHFGSGGSPDADVTGTGQSITLSTTWTKYSLTFDVPSIIGKTLGTTANTSYTSLNIWLDAGATFATRSGTIGQASKVVSIAQVQLEEGSVATPFEYRPIAEELALCQRYYENLTYAWFFKLRESDRERGTHYQFKVTKRVLPTVTIVTSTQALTQQSLTVNNVIWRCTAADDATIPNATAVNFSAEL